MSYYAKVKVYGSPQIGAVGSTFHLHPANLIVALVIVNILVISLANAISRDMSNPSCPSFTLCNTGLAKWMQAEACL